MYRSRVKRRVVWWRRWYTAHSEASSSRTATSTGSEPTVVSISRSCRKTAMDEGRGSSQRRDREPHDERPGSARGPASKRHGAPNDEKRFEPPANQDGLVGAV